jgi:hypothetical protein
VAALLVAATVAGLATAIGPSSARAAGPAPNVDQFKIGLGCVESSGDYRARNPQSGAYGKYQIMPANWPVWAATYLGDRTARQTPANQETIVTGEVRFLRRYMRSSWPRVAHWWLTGSTDPHRSHWSGVSRHYVDRVMHYARAARTPEGRSLIPASCLSRPATAAAAAHDRIAIVRLRLRGGHGSAAPVLGRVKAGTRMHALQRGWDALGRRWYRVSLPDGRTGWVAGWLTRRA